MNIKSMVNEHLNFKGPLGWVAGERSGSCSAWSSSE